MAKGQRLFARNCAACHRASGRGAPPVYPALRGSRVANGSKRRHIRLVLFGVHHSAMQAFGEQLNDETLAAILTYVRNSWGNGDRQKYGRLAGGTVTAAEVAAYRQAGKVND